MKKEVITLSLGGSLIFNKDEINIKFLSDFKRIILKNSKNYKFIIVCGGGKIARMYIDGLKLIGANERLQSFAGISVTRTNARFLSYFFGNENQEGIPSKIEEVEKMLKNKSIIFCGALEYHPNQTSDSTASEIAKHFKTEFINITNVEGMFSKNPMTNKDAKFIPAISWKEFNKAALKIEFKPGMHFVLDQKASKIIMDNKIKTYIIGDKIKNLDNLLNKRKFKGTIIFG